MKVIFFIWLSKVFTFGVNPAIFWFCHPGSVLFVVSVFVPTPSLRPKISFHHITGGGGEVLEPPQAQTEVKLPNEMILCTGVYGEISSSWLKTKQKTNKQTKQKQSKNKNKNKTRKRVIRVVFQDQGRQLPGDNLRVHIGSAKTCTIGEMIVFLINHVHKFWKGHDRNVEKKK